MQTKSCYLVCRDADIALPLVTRDRFKRIRLFSLAPAELWSKQATEFSLIYRGTDMCWFKKRIKLATITDKSITHSLFSLLLDFLLATEALEDEPGFADDVNLPWPEAPAAPAAD